ncbi:myo-inositol-1(or 4)-monophosphatase [Spirosomataceae bacterium TFI 002]|nr:myo-inositol-1(or 4)-monophosphatase [Spirosomataceae bacterium TFI 002]
MEEKLDLRTLVKETILVAQEAAEFIQKESKAFKSSSIEYKDVNNVVSYVDKETEKLIVKGLNALGLSAGFITEEETVATSDQNGLNWIIDPLDGTANYVHGLPHYSVSIALSKGNDVLLGVVVHAVTGEVFHAIKGGGAFKNNEPISVSKNDDLGKSLLATGFPYYKFEGMSKYLQILESLMQKTHGLRRFGSAALDLAHVAEGFYDGFYEYNLNSYDMAAGVLLVQEAGGIVTDFEGGNEYLFRGDVVAGNAHQINVLKEIQKYWS